MSIFIANLKAIGIVDIVRVTDAYTHIYLQKNRKLHKFATTNSILKKSIISDMHHLIADMYINFQQVGLVDQSKPCTQNYLQIIATCINLQLQIGTLTRCTLGVRVFSSLARMRSSNSVRINKSNFTTEKIV